MTDVRIELNENDVQNMTDSQKLGSLVKIAFANHNLLSEHGKIIFGNGDPQKGLCFQVAEHSSFLKQLSKGLWWMVGVFGTVLSGVIIVLIQHSLKIH
jgi:hypothetical protein